MMSDGIGIRLAITYRLTLIVYADSDVCWGVWAIAYRAFVFSAIFAVKLDRIYLSSDFRSARLSLAAAASLASKTPASRARFSSCSANTFSSTVPLTINL